MNFTDGVTDDLLRKQGVGIEGFIHLDSLGLVPRGSIGYAFDAPQAEVEYGGKKYLLKGVQQYRLSVRVLTSVGSELAPLCDTEIDAEYLTHWIEEWKNNKVEVQES